MTRVLVKGSFKALRLKHSLKPGLLPLGTVVRLLNKVRIPVTLVIW